MCVGRWPLVVGRWCCLMFAVCSCRVDVLLCWCFGVLVLGCAVGRRRVICGPLCVACSLLSVVRCLL